jgi:beta-galactosidase
MGTEMYWHGILDYANRDNRRLAELADLYHKTQAIAAAAASEHQAGFAVLKDYDNVWDATIDRWHQRVEQASEAGIFQAAQLTHAQMDYVYLTESVTLEQLQKYPVLFYPHAVILTKERAALLEAYVAAGGVLVLGCRTGYKDLTGKCPMHKLPGLLQKLSGADVIDFTFVAPDDGMITVDWEGTELEAAIFNDILEPLADAKTVGVYTKSYYAGKPALIRNDWGKGTAYYFGGVFTRNAARVFLEKLGLAEPYAGIIETPEDCELVTRTGQNAVYYFILNYSKKPAVLTLAKELRDMYTGKPLRGRVALPPYGTAVYKGDVS